MTLAPASCHRPGGDTRAAIAPYRTPAAGTADPERLYRFQRRPARCHTGKPASACRSMRMTVLAPVSQEPARGFPKLPVMVLVQ